MRSLNTIRYAGSLGAADKSREHLVLNVHGYYSAGGANQGQTRFAMSQFLRTNYQNRRPISDHTAFSAPNCG
jgi:hypothetical protein